MSWWELMHATYLGTDPETLDPHPEWWAMRERLHDWVTERLWKLPEGAGCSILLEAEVAGRGMVIDCAPYPYMQTHDAYDSMTSSRHVVIYDLQEPGLYVMLCQKVHVDDAGHFQLSSCIEHDPPPPDEEPDGYWDF